MEDQVRMRSTFVIEGMETADVLAQLHRGHKLLSEVKRELKASIAAQKKSTKILTVDMAIRCASELVVRKTAGFSISRKAMQKDGMTQREWAWAIAVLRYCSLISAKSPTKKNGKYTFRWLDNDTGEIHRSFSEGTIRLRNQASNPYESLKAMLIVSVRGK